MKKLTLILCLSAAACTKETSHEKTCGKVTGWDSTGFKITYRNDLRETLTKDTAGMKIGADYCKPYKY